ncbi:hypothetical protein BST27_28970, partial [Mycobacterium intermedium]
MSFVGVVPEAVAAAAANLAGVGSALSAANAAAVVPTTQVLVAAGDEVSAAVAALFADHAQDYQALSAQVAGYHARFVQALTGADVDFGGDDPSVQVLDEIGRLGQVL